MRNVEGYLKVKTKTSIQKDLMLHVKGIVEISTSLNEKLLP